MSRLIKLKAKQLNFEEVRFVAGVINLKDRDLKPTFQFIHSTGDELAATDGRRLYVAKKEFPEGYYELIKRTKNEVILHKSEEEIEFPKWKNIIPEKYHEWPTHEINPATSKGYIRLSRRLPERMGVDFSFMGDLKSHLWDVYVPPIDGPFQPIPFESKWWDDDDNPILKAFIMPIQLQEASA